MRTRIPSFCLPYVQIIAEDLEADADHTLEVEPVFTGDKAQELKLESICVAGGHAALAPAP